MTDGTDCDRQTVAEYSNQTFSSAVTIMQGMKSVYGKAVIDFKTNLGSNL